MTDREEEIRTIAYHLWEQEGRPEGHDVEEWLRAESQWETRQRKRVTEVRPTSYFRTRPSASSGPRYRTDRPLSF